MDAKAVRRDALVFWRAGQTFILKVGGALTAYIFLWFLARNSTELAFGQTVFFLNLALFGAIITARGGNTQLVRFYPEAKRNGDDRHLVGWTMRRGAIAASLLALFAAFALFLGGQYGIAPPFEPGVIIAGVSLVPLVWLANMQASLNQARQNFFLTIFPKDILWRLMFIAVVAAWMTLTSSELGAFHLLLLLSGCLALIVTSQIGSLRGASSSGSPDRERWRRSANSFWVTASSNAVLNFGSVVVVGLVLGPVEAGLFFVANRIAMLLGLFSNAYAVVLSPVLSTANQKRSAIQFAVRQATLQAGLPTISGALALMAFGPQILSLFGPAFSSAMPVLALLTGGWLVTAAFGPAEVVLNMCNRERDASRVALISLIVAGLVLPVFCWLWGSIGAAFAVLFATAFRKAAFSLVLWETLRLRTDIPAQLKG